MLYFQIIATKGTVSYKILILLPIELHKLIFKDKHYLTFKMLIFC